MQSKRDYLVSKGLAKPGRGKFSNAAKEELARAEASGIKFSDVARPVPVLGKKEEPKSTPVATESAYLAPSDYRFPESEYRAVGPNGREYGMRECCNTCGVSLVNHACNTPTIHDNISVSITDRR